MNILKLSVATLAFFSALTAGVTDINVEVGPITVQTCVNTAGGCSQVVNAIGDVISIDASKLKVENLGSISAARKLELQLPTQPGTYTSYSFSPTAGELQGKKILVIFDNVAQRAGTKDFGKNIVKIYRQIDGDKANQWVEVGSLSSPKPAASYTFDLASNGTLTTTNQKNMTEVSIKLGTKDVNKLV